MVRNRGDVGHAVQWFAAPEKAGANRGAPNSPQEGLMPRPAQSFPPTPPAQGLDRAIRIVPCKVLLDVNIVNAASVFFLLRLFSWIWDSCGGHLSFPPGCTSFLPLHPLWPQARPASPDRVPWGPGSPGSRRGVSPALAMVVPVCVALPALPHNHPLVPHLYPTQRRHSPGALSSSLPSSLSRGFPSRLLQHRRRTALSLVAGGGGSRRPGCHPRPPQLL